MTFAAIWAVERLVEPAADAAASLNLAVATRGVGAIIAAIAIAYAMRQLGAQPTGAQGSLQSVAWAPLRTLGWAAALIILLATVTGYVAFATFLVNQAIYLSIVGAALYIADIIAQDGIQAVFKPDGPIGARLLAMAGLRRNALAQISVILQGVARVVVLVVSRGGASHGACSAGHVGSAALGLFRLLVRRRHPVLVVADRRGDRLPCRVLHPAHPELAGSRLAADTP
jgi:hypothetical protein